MFDFFKKKEPELLIQQNEFGNVIIVWSNDLCRAYLNDGSHYYKAIVKVENIGELDFKSVDKAEEAVKMIKHKLAKKKSKEDYSKKLLNFK